MDDCDQDRCWDSDCKMSQTYYCGEEEQEERREPEPKMRGGKPKLDGENGTDAKDGAVAAVAAAAAI